MNHPTSQRRSADMNSCIRACSTCHDVCVETIAYCLGQGGAHSEPAHIALLQTCADICRTSADAMLRGADVHVHTCRACAAVCAACADDCASMGDDEQMRQCAETCRSCAAECAKMAKAA